LQRGAVVDNSVNIAQVDGQEVAIAAVESRQISETAVWFWRVVMEPRAASSVAGNPSILEVPCATPGSADPGAPSTVAKSLLPLSASLATAHFTHSNHPAAIYFYQRKSCWRCEIIAPESWIAHGVIPATDRPDSTISPREGVRRWRERYTSRCTLWGRFSL
jgi:hypothetical protein